jgi:hypothetical protein
MLSNKQTEILLRPIDPSRVAKRDGMSHLQAWDVRRWLIRIFGVDGFSIDTIDVTMLYEDTEHTLNSGKPGVSVGYRATVRLAIHDAGSTFTEAAVGDGVMPTFKRAEAHDFAIKTAVSQAMKRCAVNLGDQFGLSLYANTPSAVVKDTVPFSERRPEGTAVQDGPSLTDDEPVSDVEHDPTTEPPTPEQTEVLTDPTEAVEAFTDQLETVGAITVAKKRSTDVARIAIAIKQAGLGARMTRYNMTLDALVDWAMTGPHSDGQS